MTPHTTDTLPVPPDVIVRVDLGDGSPVVDRADAFNWGPGAGPDGEGRILGYEELQRRAARGATRARCAALPRQLRPPRARTLRASPLVSDYLHVWMPLQ
jgi:hypothetical protein